MGSDRAMPLVYVSFSVSFPWMVFFSISNQQYQKGRDIKKYIFVGARFPSEVAFKTGKLLSIDSLKAW